MEDIQLSQEEMKYLLAMINMSFKTGQLQTGDALIIVPIVKKLQEKIIPDKEPKDAPPVKKDN